MDNKTPYESFPDLEIIELRKRVRELEQQLSQAQAVLRENGLEDVKTVISDEEAIITRQIAKFKELSDKNVQFNNDDYKNLDILVKGLLAIRGKAAPVEKKAKKKEEKHDVAKLLKIAQGSDE